MEGLLYSVEHKDPSPVKDSPAVPVRRVVAPPVSNKPNRSALSLDDLFKERTGDGSSGVPTRGVKDADEPDEDSDSSKDLRGLFNF